MIAGMGLQTAEALILDVTDLHDRDRIVTFLTREYGKKRGVARGARVKHSRFGGQLQPLAKVEVTWFEKEGSDLVRISSVELVRTAHLLQADLEGLLLGSYLADHLLEFAQEQEASDHLFRLLDSTLEALLAGVDRDLATRYFEAWVLRLAGVFPSPHACPSCGGPFAAEGAILPRARRDAALLRLRRRDGLRISRRDARLPAPDRPRGAARRRPGSPPAPAVLRQVEDLCAQVRRHFLQRELRSYDVIQKTLARLS